MNSALKKTPVYDRIHLKMSTLRCSNPFQHHYGLQHEPQPRAQWLAACVSQVCSIQQMSMEDTYFNMDCSFSSSFFCRSMTERMIFRSSSVRWLRSGISGWASGAGEGVGPPRGPTGADIFRWKCYKKDPKYYHPLELIFRAMS